jgi:hypothetical protein
MRIRTMTTKSLATLAAATLVAAFAAHPARAEVNARCYNGWNAALITLALGKKCNYMDAATADRIGKSQDARMACAIAKASAAEKADVARTAAAAQADSVTRVAQMQCVADVRKAYDAQVAKLAK